MRWSGAALVACQYRELATLHRLCWEVAPVGTPISKKFFRPPHGPINDFQNRQSRLRRASGSIGEVKEGAR